MDKEDKLMFDNLAYFDGMPEEYKERLMELAASEASPIKTTTLAEIVEALEAARDAREWVLYEVATSDYDIELDTNVVQLNTLLKQLKGGS